MNHRYKNNALVKLIETDYMHKDLYHHHGNWEVKIVSLIPEEEWFNPLVPEYEVMYNRKRYRVPQYSIDTYNRK